MENSTHVVVNGVRYEILETDHRDGEEWLFYLQETGEDRS